MALIFDFNSNSAVFVVSRIAAKITQKGCEILSLLSEFLLYLSELLFIFSPGLSKPGVLGFGVTGGYWGFGVTLLPHV